jgi:hypothetical protein
MTQRDYIPAADAEFNNWLNNFAQKVELYESELELSAQDLLEIQGAKADFATDYSALLLAKKALEGSTETKNVTRESSTVTARKFAKKFKGIPGISPSVLSALGIVTSTTSGPVTVVTDLTVNGCADGVNTLKWKRNGNPQGTQFIIEVSPNGNTLWDLVDVVTKTKFDHTGQVPGERQYYRVRSKRAGISSVPSPSVVVYSNGNDPGLELAA